MSKKTISILITIFIVTISIILIIFIKNKRKLTIINELQPKTNLLQKNKPREKKEQSCIEKLKNISISEINENEFQNLINELIDQGTSTIPFLVDFLNKEELIKEQKLVDKQWAMKITVMNVLADWEAREALGILEKMLVDSNDASVIYNSAKTIGEIGGEKSYEILKQALKNEGDANTIRKKAAILRLGLYEDSKAIPILEQELFDSQNDMITQIYAGTALGFLGSTEGLEIATNGIKSNDSNIKLYAIEALGIIGAPSSLPILRNLSQADEKYIYKTAALMATIQIEAKQLFVDDKIEYIRKKLLDHSDNTKLVLWGTSELKKINNESSIQALEYLSKSPSPFLRNTALRKLKTINKEINKNLSNINVYTPKLKDLDYNTDTTDWRKYRNDNNNELKIEFKYPDQWGDPLADKWLYFFLVHNNKINTFKYCDGPGCSDLKSPEIGISFDGIGDESVYVSKDKSTNGYNLVCEEKSNFKRQDGVIIETCNFRVYQMEMTDVAQKVICAKQDSEKSCIFLKIVKPRGDIISDVVKRQESYTDAQLDVQHADTINGIMQTLQIVP